MFPALVLQYQRIRIRIWGLPRVGSEVMQGCVPRALAAPQHMKSSCHLPRAICKATLFVVLRTLLVVIINVHGHTGEVLRRPPLGYWDVLSYGIMEIICPPIESNYVLMMCPNPPVRCPSFAGGCRTPYNICGDGELPISD